MLQIVLNQLDLEKSWTFTFSSLYVGYSVASRIQYNTDSVCALQQGILKKKDGEGEHHCMIQEKTTNVIFISSDFRAHSFQRQESEMTGSPVVVGGCLFFLATQN